MLTDNHAWSDKKLARESLIKSGRIILGCKMIKVKARNASNSQAIAKFRNIGINYFVPKMVVHDLIRGSLGSISILNIPEFEINSYTDTRIV